jgi:hypothetical protein
MKTYTKEQITEVLRATFKNIDNKLAEALTRLDLQTPVILDLPSGARERVAEKLKRLFHRDLEERDWEKIAGDIVQLAQAPLEAPTEEEARVVHEEYTGYAGASIPSMLHALRRFVERRNSAAKPAPVLPQFKVGDRVRLVRTDGLSTTSECVFANKVSCVVGVGDISQGRLLTEVRWADSGVLRSAV